jgi:hypothetical protein
MAIFVGRYKTLVAKRSGKFGSPRNTHWQGRDLLQRPRPEVHQVQARARVKVCYQEEEASSWIRQWFYLRTQQPRWPILFVAVRHIIRSSPNRYKADHN